MNPDTCPRCGLPENWTLRLRLRLVWASIAAVAALGFVAGRIFP